MSLEKLKAIVCPILHDYLDNVMSEKLQEDMEKTEPPLKAYYIQRILGNDTNIKLLEIYNNICKE